MGLSLHKIYLENKHFANFVRQQFSPFFFF